jgi:hypothetical protein
VFYIERLNLSLDYFGRSKYTASKVFKSLRKQVILCQTVPIADLTAKDPIAVAGNVKVILQYFM